MNKNEEDLLRKYNILYTLKKAYYINMGMEGKELGSKLLNDKDLKYLKDKINKESKNEK